MTLKEAVQPLPQVVVDLRELPAVIARYVGSRHVGVAGQPAVRLAIGGELEHPARPLEVDRTGLAERQRERHGRFVVG